MSKSLVSVVLIFLLGKIKWGWFVAFFFLLFKNSMKLYHWHYTVEQTSSVREAGSWKPIILFSTPRGRAAPESCRETFQLPALLGSSQLWQGSVSMATGGLIFFCTQDMLREVTG